MVTSSSGTFTKTTMCCCRWWLGRMVSWGRCLRISCSIMLLGATWRSGPIGPLRRTCTPAPRRPRVLWVSSRLLPCAGSGPARESFSGTPTLLQHRGNSPSVNWGSLLLRLLQSTFGTPTENWAHRPHHLLSLPPWTRIRTCQTLMILPLIR